MKVVGLDGKEYNWTLSSSKLEDSDRSGLHLKARTLLNDIFPFDIIYEDVSLPGSSIKGRSSILFADFYIPIRSIIIEVNGEQHHKYVNFFHKNKLDYYKAKGRDLVKSKWCSLNNITLINFEYNETIEKWKQKLQ